LWGNEDWKSDEEKRLAKLRRRQEVFTYVNLCGGGEKYPDKKETSAGLRRGCVGYGNKKTTFQQRKRLHITSKDSQNSDTSQRTTKKGRGDEGEEKDKIKGKQKSEEKKDETHVPWKLLLLI
jgi:hypothetical protein